MFNFSVMVRVTPSPFGENLAYVQAVALLPSAKVRATSWECRRGYDVKNLIAIAAPMLQASDLPVADLNSLDVARDNWIEARHQARRADMESRLQDMGFTNGERGDPVLPR